MEENMNTNEEKQSTSVSSRAAMRNWGDDGYEIYGVMYAPPRPELNVKAPTGGSTLPKFKV